MTRDSPYVRARRAEITPAPKQLTPTEHDEQVALIQWWALVHHRFGVAERLLFAIPNAGAGSQKGQAGKMKAEGVRQGIPDLFLSVPRGGHHGLYIEMKRRTKKPRPEQFTMLATLNEQGYMAIWCDSAELAMGEITEYLSPSDSGS